MTDPGETGAGQPHDRYFCQERSNLQRLERRLLRSTDICSFTCQLPRSLLPRTGTSSRRW